jgi:hypothetical protein
MCVRRESREEAYDLVERNRKDDRSVHALVLIVAARLDTLAGLGIGYRSASP